MPKIRKRKHEIDEIEEASNKVEEKLNDERFNAKIETDKNRRLEYLLEKTSLYRHFISKEKTNNETNALIKRAKKDIRESSIEKSGTYEGTPSFIKNGAMRQYQIEGLNWMISLYNNGINGILADEMGLGKTLQTISLLGHLKHVKKINGPFLIIVPKSTISNWVNEIRRWCPSLKAVAVVGRKLERKDIIENELFYYNKWDICLTTYKICMIEKRSLKVIKWHYIVIDEAHRIKNENTVLSKVLKSFQSINRLLITGTPLQNNLHELWALLNYSLPEIFDSSNDFDLWFNTFDCLESKDKTKMLHSLLMPFMLQRFKQDVEKNLLPKKEITIYVGLSEMQRECYKKVLKDDMTVINGNGSVAKVRLSNILVHLFKVASHPYIFSDVEPTHLDPFGEHLVSNSGKMIILDKLLKKLKDQGSRVVLFGHFVKLLNIFEDYCHMRGYKYLRLDGSTSQRDRESGINKFNAEGSEIFLYIISTTAGGLGINLQTADVVILFQSHFNPQVDLQAIDRVHRIGQKKQVRIFRIISENTVEEKLIERAAVKLKLNEVVISNHNKLKYNMNTEKLLDIIRFGADKIFSKDSKAIDSATIKDEDIDAIMQRCEQSTSNCYRLDNNININNTSETLKNLNLENYFETEYIYNFEGENYRKKNEVNVIFQLPERQCRQKIHSYYAGKYYDFQFLPRKIYKNIENLSPKEVRENLRRGFPNWDKEDFEEFINALKKYGRDENMMKKIARDVKSKSISEVRKYYKKFWQNCHKLKDTSFLQEIPNSNN